MKPAESGTPANDSAPPAVEVPDYRPLERFWPYADLPEQPTDEELASLDPELHEALFGTTPHPFSVTLHFLRSTYPTLRARSTWRGRQPVPGNRRRRRRRHRARFIRPMRRAAEAVRDRRARRRHRRADRRSAAAVRPGALAAADVVPDLLTRSILDSIRMAEPTDIQKDLQLLAAELKRLEGEYNMFFSGRLPRPPWETRAGSTRSSSATIAAYIMGTGDRFRFEMLQSRFQHSSSCGTAGCARAKRGVPARSRSRRRRRCRRRRSRPKAVVHVTAFTDPVREIDKLHWLYDSLVDARRGAGEDMAPFNKFAALVKNQVSKLRDQGTPGGCVPRRGQGREGRVYRTANEGEAQKFERVEGVMAGELETGTPCGVPVWCRRCAGFRYVTGLLALRAIDDLELDRLAFFERPEVISLDRREVHEYVRPTFAFNEPVTLRVVEPLDLACDTHRAFPALRCAAHGAASDPSPATARGSGREHKKRPRVRGLGLRQLAPQPAAYATRICL